MSGKRANGEGSVTFDKNRGDYVARITVGLDSNGRPKRHKFRGRTRTEANERMTAARAAIAAGLHVPDERITVGQWLSRWLETLPGQVSEGTEDTYRRVVRLYLEPSLGHLKLRQLLPTHVDKLMKDMAGRGLSAHTCRLARSVLRRSLRVAEQHGIVSRNVAAIADGPRLRHEEARTLTIEQARVLLDQASKHRLHAAVVVMLALGLRRGEALGLSWAHVDLESDPPVAHVRRQLQRMPGRGQVLVDLKTSKSRRSVDLPEFVADALRAHRRRQAEERLKAGPGWQGGDDLVFTTPMGSPQDGRNLNRVLSQIATDAGLGHWHPHELRHSAISIMLAAGVPLDLVSEIAGHSSIRVTKDTYGHLLPGAKAVAATAMERVLAG